MSNNANNWTHGVAWSEKYETGYGEIDEQHKNLFKLVSDLIESGARKDSSVTVEETLLFLAEYTVKHFADEEKIALSYKYPHCEEHKKMHENFTETVAGLCSQYKKDGDSDALLIMVEKVVVRWLVKHIQGEDFKIAKHIKEIKNK